MTTTYYVTGLTCENCVKHLTSDFLELPEVSEVHIDLAKGGQSLVKVTATPELTPIQVQEVISEAGYSLAADS